MAISIGDALLKLGVDDSELDAGMKKAVGDIKSQMKTAGVALTGFGLAITGALTMAVKSAAEEEAGIIKLTQALANVGVEYDSVKDSLEGVINATQQKTSIADDQQRAALQSLLEVTGDYNKALELLPLALDMAAAKGMDAASASQIIGRVAQGNTTILSRYGIQLREGATATEALGSLQQKFGGQAAAYGQSVAGQFALIKNNISDVMESIGGTLLPILRDLFVNHINPLITSLKAWADEHPGLVKQLVILVGVVGGFAAILGPILIMLPTLAASFTLLMGPVGLVILAITALVAVGTLIVMNWETISRKAKEIWGGIADFFSNVWESISGYVKENWDKILAILFPAVGLPVLIARNWGAISDIVKNIWEGITGFVKNGWDNVVEFMTSGVNRLIDQVNKAIDLINKVPGVNIGKIGQIGQELPGMANGGMINEPTLLSSLKTGLPYAIAGEAGPERVSPMGQTANIVIMLDGKTIGRAMGQPLVDEIRVKTGVRL